MNGPTDESNSTPPGAAQVEQLRARRDEVPADVAQRLERMRRVAVAELAPARSPGIRWRGPAWAGGLAGTAAALLLTVTLLRSGPEDGFERLLLADARELAAVAELEVLEDLEFLIWLDQELADADPG